MRFSRIFLIICLILLVSTIGFKPKYDLSVERTGVSSWIGVYEGGMYMVTYTQKVWGPKNTWYLGVDKSVWLSDIWDLCVDWKIGNEEKSSTECLDIDAENSANNEDSADSVFTFPILSQNISSGIHFTVRSTKPFQDRDITLYSMNTQAQWYDLAFELPKLTADTTVVSRADWWADETMRYADSSYWKEKYPDYLKYVQRPKTQSELDAIYLDRARVDFLKKYFPDTTKTMSLSRYNNGHLLVWPTQKVKKVNRIVLHHTAEDMNSAASDEEVLRAMYAYHTLSRQWGDIGYNYIVWQRGKIYEWRAGGDYVVASHTQYNNMGTVGIATMGNFQNMTLNRDQQAGLEEAITMVAKKYGITLSAQVPWVHVCNTATCSPLQLFTGSSLLGHRDIGVTACPGDNLYKLILPLIEKLNVPYISVLNTTFGTIDPPPKEEKMNMAPMTTIISSPPSWQDIHLLVASFKRVQYVGKKLKVKLSYPDEKNIALSPLDPSVRNISLWSKKLKSRTWEKIEVWIVWNNQLEVKIGANKYIWKYLKVASTVVQIDSWTRIPAWDSGKNHNDNLFRDTVTVKNDNGKLLIINELPLEWYLKWLGEVSNGDMPEKIKTIIVAARSYAKYYMSPQNRKYKTSLYDASDDPDSFQKYLWYSYESRSLNVAHQVDATKWLVITYNKKPIKPWYFSSSSWKTLSYLEYCRSSWKSDCSDIPYLQSVDDPGAYGHTQSGHGVGISWVWATYWAGQWWDYTKIIAYYLPGTKVERK